MCATKNSEGKNHLSPPMRNLKRVYRATGPSDSSGFFSRKGGSGNTAPRAPRSLLRAAAAPLPSAAEIANSSATPNSPTPPSEQG
jgi:hypothetical protein